MDNFSKSIADLLAEGKTLEAAKKATSGFIIIHFFDLHRRIRNISPLIYVV